MSFESGFKQRKGRRISEVGWQRVPDKVQESRRNALRTFWCCALGLSGASHTMSEGFVLVHMHIESEKDTHAIFCILSTELVYNQDKRISENLCSEFQGQVLVQFL